MLDTPGAAKLPAKTAPGALNSLNQGETHVLPAIFELVENHPAVTTTAGISTLILSEVLGFTRKGGIIRVLCDLLIAIGVGARAFKKERTEKKRPPAE